MIDLIKLENFRGFRKHTIPFKDSTVIVGKNNAGKSTIVEALRLVALVSSKYRTLPYRTPPAWLDIDGRYYGVSPSLQYFDLEFATLFYGYHAPPCKITCQFQGKSSITIYIGGKDQIFALIRSGAGTIVKSKKQAVACNIPSVAILPQIGPLRKKEEILSREYLRERMSSALLSKHFRNHLNLNGGSLEKLQTLISQTWPTVQIAELLGLGGYPGEPLHLEIRDDTFVSEVGSMGHGLQMWLQTMFFLTMWEGVDTVILDEPDVYMHADLQRKLVRLLNRTFPQFIIATHSVEIMSEVEPENILIIDRSVPQSSFANSIPGVQEIIDSVGSIYNINLSRIWNGKKILMVEGKDIKLLSQFHKLLFPATEYSLDAIPNLAIGGWGGWNNAMGTSLIVKNAIGDKMNLYCILDSDYHVSGEMEARYGQARSKDVLLHIWSMKELENYLLNPIVISRVIGDRLRAGGRCPSPEEVFEKMMALSDGHVDEMYDGFAQSIMNLDRRLGSGANKKARELVKMNRDKYGDILHLVPGKSMVSELSGWSQSEFGVSFGPGVLIKYFLKNEIPNELVSVLTAIENCVGFDEVALITTNSIADRFVVIEQPSSAAVATAQL